MPVKTTISIENSDMLQRLRVGGGRFDPPNNTHVVTLEKKSMSKGSRGGCGYENGFSCGKELGVGAKEPKTILTNRMRILQRELQIITLISKELFEADKKLSELTLIVLNRGFPSKKGLGELRMD